MSAVHWSFARIVAALLLVALFPIELGGPVAAQSVLGADDVPLDHEQPDETHIEQPSPDGVDFLEVEDDEASVSVVAAAALWSRPVVPSVSDLPAHVHLDDFERPPRG